MHNPIPPFDHNLVLPPHKGDPRNAADLSPYPCTTVELCQRFATSPERVLILTGFLNFREFLRSNGLTTAFQWIDGSFLEDVEARETRPPGDIDIVTAYWGLDPAAQTKLVANFPEFADPIAAKAKYHVDHYPFQIDHEPIFTIEYTRYWMQLFTHNRDAVWKGMLKIDLDTPSEDTDALAELAKITP